MAVEKVMVREAAVIPLRNALEHHIKREDIEIACPHCLCEYAKCTDIGILCEHCGRVLVRWRDADRRKDEQST